MKKRKSNIDSIQKAAKDVMERSDEDTSLLQSQLIDLSTKWDTVSSLSTSKQQRLTDAYSEVCFTACPSCIVMMGNRAEMLCVVLRILG